jgi:flagellar basal-body rod protein FlgC
MKIQRMFVGFNISSRGLSAQRKKMNTIADNIANAETTRTEEGGPYKRKFVHIKSNTQQAFSKVLHATGLSLTRTDAAHFPDEGIEDGSPETLPANIDASEQEDASAFKMVHDPGHPDADANGYVKMPNVNIVTEMVDMISASRSYEANITAVNAAKTMAKDSLEI